MEYIYRDENGQKKEKAEFPIANFQIACYDGCVQFNYTGFDELYIEPEKFDCHWLMYLETEEEQLEERDHFRIFVNMRNGDCFELELRKLSHKQCRESGHFYGGRRESKNFWLKKKKRYRKRLKESIEEKIGCSLEEFKLTLNQREIKSLEDDFMEGISDKLSDEEEFFLRDVYLPGREDWIGG